MSAKQTKTIKNLSCFCFSLLCGVVGTIAYHVHDVSERTGILCTYNGLHRCDCKCAWQRHLEVLLHTSLNSRLFPVDFNQVLATYIAVGTSLSRTLMSCYCWVPDKEAYSEASGCLKSTATAEYLLTTCIFAGTIAIKKQLFTDSIDKDQHCLLTY